MKTPLSTDTPDTCSSSCTRESHPDYLPGFGNPPATPHPQSVHLSANIPFTFPCSFVYIDPSKINWNKVLNFLQQEENQMSLYTRFYLASWYAALRNTPNIKPFYVKVESLDVQGKHLPELHDHIHDYLGYELATEQQYALFQFYRISCGDTSILTNTPPMHLRGDSDLHIKLHLGPPESVHKLAEYPYHKLFGNQCASKHSGTPWASKHFDSKSLPRKASDIFSSNEAPRKASKLMPSADVPVRFGKALSWSIAQGELPYALLQDRMRSQLRASRAIPTDDPKSPYCAPIKLPLPHPGAYFMLVCKA